MMLYGPTAAKRKNAYIYRTSHTHWRGRCSATVRFDRRSNGSSYYATGGAAATLSQISRRRCSRHISSSGSYSAAFDDQKLMYQYLLISIAGVASDGKGADWITKSTAFAPQDSRLPVHSIRRLGFQSSKTDQTPWFMSGLFCPWLKSPVSSKSQKRHITSAGLLSCKFLCTAFVDQPMVDCGVPFGPVR